MSEQSYPEHAVDFFPIQEIEAADKEEKKKCYESNTNKRYKGGVFVLLFISVSWYISIN